MLFYLSTRRPPRYTSPDTLVLYTTLYRSRKGHVLLSEMVGSGEVPVALTVYNSEAESIMRRGGPVAWKPLQPVVGRPQGIGVARNAPNPARKSTRMNSSH